MPAEHVPFSPTVQNVAKTLQTCAVFMSVQQGRECNPTPSEVQQ